MKLKRMLKMLVYSFARLAPQVGDVGYFSYYNNIYIYTLYTPGYYNTP